MNKLISLFILSALSLNLNSQSKNGYDPDILGVWLSENKKQKVRVSYDAEKKMYNGKLIWMYEDDWKQGRKLFDKKNPDPTLRSRRVTGINFLHSFKYEGNSVYRGYIYDPISGKEYRCLLTIQPDKKTAHIRGYILIPWIGRTEIATKISD